MEPFFILDCCTQHGFLSLSTQIFHQIQEPAGIRIPGGFLFPAAVFRQAEGFGCLKPQARRKHGANCFIKGAEITLPNKRGQPQQCLGNHRLFIQLLLHSFQVTGAFCFHCKHHALRAAIAAAKGYHYPHTGLKGHPLRNRIGVRLIDGKVRRRYSNSCDHTALSFRVTVSFVAYGKQFADVAEKISCGTRP